MEINRRHRGSRSHNGRLTFAFILIAIGIILLAVNTGWMPNELKQVFISWQMLLIVIGAAKLAKGRFAGLVLIFVGGFFLMPVINRVAPDFFNFIPTDFIHLYWPVLLIALGALLIIRWVIPSNFTCRGRLHEKKFHQQNTSGGYIEINNVLGGSEQIVLDPVFKGGEINSIFGGTKLDLRKTSLPEGLTTLEINAVFGGIEILVPNGWKIDFSVDAILGGFEDKRYRDQTIDSSRTLLIKGACILGGGELRN